MFDTFSGDHWQDFKKVVLTERDIHYDFFTGSITDKR